MFEKEKRYSFKQGLPKKVISTPYFTIRFASAADSIGTNAVVVSKKVSKKAVLRNKIKRKILSLLKDNLGERADKYDLVLYIKPEINEASDSEIEEAVQTSIKKL